MNMLNLITGPDEFFAKMKEKDPNLKKPAVIVFLLAVIIAYYQFKFIMKLSTAFPDNIARFLELGATINIFGSFLGVFAMWLVVAVIMHGLSAFFNGKGEFRRTFEFTGYGFLPSLLGSAVTVPLTLSYLENTVIPKIDVNMLAANPDIGKEIIRDLLNHVPREYLYSTLALNISVTVWSFLIWTFAIRNSRGIETRKALICAAIPTVMFAMYHALSVMKLI